MEFGDIYSRDECNNRCPECTAPQPPAGEQCVRCGRSAVQRVADWPDSNALLAEPAKQHKPRFNAAHFQELLTDYDCVLLTFGMHISWKPDTQRPEPALIDFCPVCRITDQKERHR